MPDYLKSDDEVVFLTGAQVFERAIEAYRNGEFREDREAGRDRGLRGRPAPVRETPATPDQVREG